MADDKFYGPDSFGGSDEESHYAAPYTYSEWKEMQMERLNHDPYRPAPEPGPGELVFRDDAEQVFWEACVIAMLHDQKQVFISGCPPTQTLIPFRDTPTYTLPDPIPVADALVLARRKRMR